MNNLTFSKALEGYMISAESVLSPNTIRDYDTTFRKFTTYLGTDLQLDEISIEHIEGFLNANNHLKKKTLLNYHTGLSAFWTWAISRKLTDTHIPRSIRPPKPDQMAIEPFSEQDVKLLLAASQKSLTYSYGPTRPFNRKTPSGIRLKATIFLFLDTGLRVQEYCDLKIRDVDLRNKSVKVFGKGRKERMLPISPRSAQAIWSYLATRPDAGLLEPAFASVTGTKQTRDNVLHVFYSLADRAGVQNVHPHRFRHTFAINYLRNGGDIYTLQQILGHSSLDMVRRYLMIAQADIARAHRQASPVMNWGL